MRKKKDQRFSISEIDQCIDILNHMVDQSDEFVTLPKDKQIELIKAAGQLSRPHADHLKQRRKAERDIKKKQKA